jgi:hypothetical protein
LEVNDFYLPQSDRRGRLQRSETVDINEGEAVLMAHDAIHRIANPNRRTFTGAFHIYMGDYLHSSRSIWYPADASEKPASFALTKDIFAAANRDLAAARAAESEQEHHKKKGPVGHAHGAPHASHGASHSVAHVPAELHES